ncbi:MAG TPA: TadE/TadG family type IV pilus assembly protein [Egibacteraceae bacterium]|nr:TadE/TadG family type IV pilus assembly protein [Egibacteraceae bacterium]
MNTLKRKRSRGQSLAEFALILPLLITLTGAAMDFARVYQASITLQTATRNAAEFTATRSVSQSGAQTEAQRVVCTETQNLPGFTAGSGGSIPTCTAPTVTVTSFTVSTTAPGASATYPLATSVVHAELPFRTVIPWPWLPGGTWDIGTTQTYTVIQGR